MSGRHRIGLAVRGHTAIWADGRLAVEEGEPPETFSHDAVWTDPPYHVAEIEMEAGPPVEFKARWRKFFDYAHISMSLAIEKPAVSPAEAMAESERLARAADAVVLLVGTTDRDESEGHDRTSLALQPAQDDLVRRVVAANPRTVVVVSVGSPVELPWRDDAAAILLTWFPGQEAGHALADMLFGRVEPGGRLPTTWPATIEDVPVLDTQPVDGRLAYGEGLEIGYRAWLRAETAPAFPFGHGHGYTTWTYLDVEPAAADGSLGVRVRLHNSGARPGREVVQLYLARPDSSIDRPLLWLGGYAAVEAARARPSTSWSRSTAGPFATGTNRPAAGPSSRVDSRFEWAGASATSGSPRSSKSKTRAPWPRTTAASAEAPPGTNATWIAFSYLSVWGYILYGLGNATPYLRADLRPDRLRGWTARLGAGGRRADRGSQHRPRGPPDRFALAPRPVRRRPGPGARTGRPRAEPADLVVRGAAARSRGRHSRHRRHDPAEPGGRSRDAQAHEPGQRRLDGRGRGGAGCAGPGRRRSHAWRVGLLLPLAAILVLTAIRPRATEARSSVRPPRASLPGGYWFAWLLLVLGVSIEFSFVYWGSTIVARRTGVSAADATLLASLFVAGMLAGRLAIGRGFGGGRAPRGILAGGLVVVLVGATLVWIATTPPLSGSGSSWAASARPDSGPSGWRWPSRAPRRPPLRRPPARHWPRALPFCWHPRPWA